MKTERKSAGKFLFLSYVYVPCLCMRIKYKSKTIYTKAEKEEKLTLQYQEELLTYLNSHLEICIQRINKTKTNKER